MKNKKTQITLALFFLGFGTCHSQESTNAAGGEATGSTGTVSYSIGQVVYTTSTGTNGSIAQGVQQPYEISTTVGINEKTIQLEMSVYPNPTAHFLSLKVDSENLENISYQLFDAKGRAIENKKVNAAITTVEMENLPTSIYFLKVARNNEVIKTFQIIKN